VARDGCLNSVDLGNVQAQSNNHARLGSSCGAQRDFKCNCDCAATGLYL
jgi:hypothetical protein